jgi:excisionase family DNA binding protein
MDAASQLREAIGLLTSRQVAQRLNLSVWAVRRLVAAGHLPAVRFGPRGHLRFRSEEVERLIAGER